MARNKKKTDIIYKKKTNVQYLSESYDHYDKYGYYYGPNWPDYIDWQESYDEDFVFYDYAYTQDGVKVCVIDDPNKIRQDKIDAILGEKGSMSNPTIQDILPNSLKINE